MKKLSSFFIVLAGLFVFSTAVIAETGTDIWQPDKNGNIRLMSDDGMTPTTFYMNADVTVAGTGSLKATNADGLGSVREWFINIPTAGTDTFKNIVGGVVISTNVLISKTSTFVDSGYFTLNKYARPVAAVFQISRDTNYVTGLFSFYGIDSCGMSRAETLAVLSTTATVSNYAYYRLLQSTLTVTTCPGMRGEPGGSTTAWDDASKVYPRIGTDSGVGLSNHPLTATVDWISEADTQKLPSTAVIFSSNAVIRFGTAPNGTNDYEVQYRTKGNR